MPRHELVSVGVGTFCDDAIGPLRSNSRQRCQIFSGSLVEIDRFFVAQPLSNAFGDSFCVALEGSSLLRSFFAQLIGVLIRGTSRTQGKSAAEQTNAEESDAHDIRMPFRRRLLAVMQIEVYPAERKPHLKSCVNCCAPSTPNEGGFR